MMFYLSKVLRFLLEPVFILFVFGLALVLAPPRLKNLRRAIAAVFLLAAACTTEAVSNTALFALEKAGYAGSGMRSEKYDYIVVLSGYVNLEASEAHRTIEMKSSADRILTGLRLFYRQVADKLVFSGGNGSLSQDLGSEAALAAQFSQSWGVPLKNIVIEPVSRNTYENAVKTAGILKPGDKVLLITSAYHMLRARGCFEKAGVDFDYLAVDFRSSGIRRTLRNPGSYLPSVAGAAKFRSVATEIAGLVAYRLNGYLDFNTTPSAPAFESGKTQ